MNTNQKLGTNLRTGLFLFEWSGNAMDYLHCFYL